MEWQQIEYFQKVAQLQHMTQAAEDLSISQPALSRSIARLEEELGIPLFERQGRSIILNQYGKVLLKHVNRILKEIDDTKKEIQSLLDPEYGEVSLGFLHTLGVNMIPNILRTFQKEHANIKIKLYQNNNVSLLKQLQAGEIDLCLVHHSYEDPHIQWEKLWDEELFLMVSASHPLARRESITLDELQSEPMIVLKEGFELRKIADKLCRKANFTPNITFEGEEVTTLAGLVAAGLGAALMPDLKDIDHSKVAKIHVRWPSCSRQIGLSWYEDRPLSPAAAHFKRFVFTHYRK
ncbi:LysR family transcriptional regulator [Sporolactobacillus inulinus]|jgi:DNA-binding transcriptional LysR family regulator|uniref:LysR family transcriptional regulator Bsu YybE n=2 Tax=Sporolactobacillus inulinus TaxID=2078 RepID=A0A4Y3T4Y3_9BACL|nr:LysR family transcriptional regulator [Sporolactobacillus inulinus]KLI03794.1 LysR family transcriptional regulator [Sporolactobacillus inulinus CASD]GAY75862.1 LysR family transcriptional regulator Bsu YybE [Sporolactobacillus inulinus]GEB76543.1 putative HTH-type transcriptional regulator YybE [Sporolactobacillus inulinus]